MDQLGMTYDRKRKRGLINIFRFKYNSRSFLVENFILKAYLKTFAAK